MKKYTLLIFFIAFPLLSFTVEETVNNKENIVVEEVKEISEKKIRTNEYTLNLKFDKYFNKEFNHFVYLNKQTAIKSAAISNSKTIKILNKGTKIAYKGKVIGKDKNEWYMIIYNKNIAYIPKNSGIIRAFNWQKAVKLGNAINIFIENTLNEGKKIYYIDVYNLVSSTDDKADKYGNLDNQSIKAYTDKLSFINLADRSLFTIVKEDSKFVYIKTMAYGEEIYKIPIKNKRYIRRLNITDDVNKFIYVDRHSQTQVTIERNRETGVFNVNNVGYVTTGLSSGAGFVTPKGIYTVAYTKPVMPYTSDTDPKKIVGDAKYAIRFSGGAYLHGIPSTYDPKESREERKKITASHLGTIPLSHKCVRNEDDSIYYLYKWVNGNNKIQKSGFTYPEENVIVIVD
jgi:erfK/ybiS/ycfS/ynhG family protein